MLLRSMMMSAIVCLAVTPHASAQLFQFNVAIDSIQEVPTNTSIGTGSATALYDQGTGLLSITGSYMDLSGVPNVAHLHGFAAAGSNAGVQFGLTLDTVAETFSGSGIVGDSASVLGGLTYINIHTPSFPGGEIRGQLVNPSAVPEPGSLALIGLAACSSILRRRRS